MQKTGQFIVPTSVPPDIDLLSLDYSSHWAGTACPELWRCHFRVTQQHEYPRAHQTRATVRPKRGTVYHGHKESVVLNSLREPNRARVPIAARSGGAGTANENPTPMRQRNRVCAFRNKRGTSRSPIRERTDWLQATEGEEREVAGGRRGGEGRRSHSSSNMSRFWTASIPASSTTAAAIPTPLSLSLSLSGRGEGVCGCRAGVRIALRSVCVCVCVQARAGTGGRG